MGYIYKITNKVNNKIYIGQTKFDILKRFKNHIITSKNYLNTKYFSSHLYEAMNLYGVDNFYIEQIEECDNDTLNEREIYWIDKLNTTNDKIGYNIAKGGQGGSLFENHKHSKETIQKMSANRKGSNNANYGNRWNQSDELKKKHSILSSGKNNGMYGKHQSKESKLKSREKHINRVAFSNYELDDVKMIYPEQFDEYISKGYFKGNIHARMFKK